jgi:hypothetical protein
MIINLKNLINSNNSKHLFFLQDGFNWKEIEFNKLKNIKNGSFFIAINIYIFHIQNLFIINNNYVIKIGKFDSNLCNANDYINDFYLDCGLKWLFDDEYKSSHPNFTDLFPIIESNLSPTC